MNNQTLLESHKSFVAKYARNVPLYDLPEQELLKNEIVLFKVGIKLNLGTSKKQLDISNDQSVHMYKSYYTYSEKRIHKYINPYTSEVFDGVMFVTNMRMILRFPSQYKDFNSEFGIDDVTLKLRNFISKDQFEKLEKRVDPKKSPYLEIESKNIKFWLLVGRSKITGRRRTRIRMLGKDYYFGNIVTYVYFSKIINYIKTNKDSTLNDIYKYLLLAFDPERGSIKRMLVLLALSFGVSMSVFIAGLILASRLQRYSFIICLSFPLLFLGMIMTLTSGAKYNVRKRKEAIENITNDEIQSLIE